MVEEKKSSFKVGQRVLLVFLDTTEGGSPAGWRAPNNEENRGVVLEAEEHRLVIRVDGEEDDPDGYEYERRAGGFWYEINNSQVPVEIREINKKCFLCGAVVGEKERQKIHEAFDRLAARNDDSLERKNEELNLIHCTGPEENFSDEDGAVIVCRKCFGKKG